MQAVRKPSALAFPAQVSKREHRDRPILRRRRAPENEIPRHSGRSGEHADESESESDARPAQVRFRNGADVEDPGDRDDDWKAERERDHHVTEHGIGPAQGVHQRLDDLQYGERRDAVADQGAKHTSSL